VTGIDLSATDGDVNVTWQSITDRVGSMLEANHCYPNYLDERVRAETRLAGYGVSDEGSRADAEVDGPNDAGYQVMADAIALDLLQ
jgi:hypothetical protein